MYPGRTSDGVALGCCREQPSSRPQERQNGNERSSHTPLRARLRSAVDRYPSRFLDIMPLSPPRSTGGSPHSMIPPSNSFTVAPPSFRTTTLAAPSLSLTGSRSPGYSSNSYSHSTSPSTGSGSLPEIHSHDSPGMMISPTQISSASLNAQKRAYRQRRKDPSCDACRERKVKVRGFYQRDSYLSRHTGVWPCA